MKVRLIPEQLKIIESNCESEQVYDMNAIVRKSINTPLLQDDTYICSQRFSKRLTRINEEYLQKLYARKYTDPVAREILQEYDFLIGSQIFILKCEKYMLSKKKQTMDGRYCTKKDIDRRLKVINSLIQNAPRAKPIENDTIGLGTKIDLITYKNGENDYSRVKMIGYAVSGEKEEEYVEAISSLGQSILGLGKNDDFEYRSRNGIVSGTILNIENNLENAVKTIEKGFSYTKKFEKI